MIHLNSKTKSPTNNGAKQATRPRVTRGRYGLPKLDANMPGLDFIHYAFLGYSGCHNAVNAWSYANGFGFFLFALVGILSVEAMLYSIYRHWKDGELVGRMKRVSLMAGMLAMFFAVAGILAKAQAGAGGWVDLYYAWILPSSAPVMFAFSFWIQAVNPTMAAERDALAYEALLNVDERRDELDKRRLDLDYRRHVRSVKASVASKKLTALRRESESWRTKWTLRRAMKKQMPKMLKELGIDPAEVGGYRGLLGKALPPAQEKERGEEEN